MKKELDDKLCEDFPKIFAQRHLNMHQTCMCWGFSCGDGWFNIIYSLCQSIQSYIDNRLENIERTKQWNKNVADPNYEWSAFVPREKRKVLKPIPQVEATQVKEKFGTLRFYTNHSDEVINNLIGLAENMSAVTCEICGSPGKLNTEGWLNVTCDLHRK
jgi:hypothetical protein